ncbi:MAG: hypothetical protein JWQ23_616 [Herminiimonas sp.]|nr:hypothetical protein [Herminiimonas sp.]
MYGPPDQIARMLNSAGPEDKRETDVSHASGGLHAVMKWPSTGEFLSRVPSVFRTVIF